MPLSSMILVYGFFLFIIVPRVYSRASKRTLFQRSDFYRSWMIRRDVPKGLSMDILGPRDIQAVESKLNNLPRRQTGYQTPKELFSAASAG